MKQPAGRSRRGRGHATSCAWPRRKNIRTSPTSSTAASRSPTPNEERDMAPSPKVATYDLQPEMSAIPLTDKVIAHLDTGLYDMLILNFANPDMVGHTGVLEAGDQVGRDHRRVPAARGGKSARARRLLPDHGRSRQLRADDQRRRHAQHRAHHQPRPIHLRRARTPTRRSCRTASSPTSRRRCFISWASRSRTEMTGHSLVTFK